MESNEKMPMLPISFIAGFFDGDGCVHFSKDTKTWSLIFSNNNREILDEVNRALDTGSNIYEDIRKNGSHYHLYISKWRDAKRVGMLFLSYSIVKKPKLIEMLKYMDKHPYHKGKLTKLERQFLQDHKHLTAKQISVVLGRTIGSIQALRKRNHELSYVKLTDLSN